MKCLFIGKKCRINESFEDVGRNYRPGNYYAIADI